MSARDIRVRERDAHGEGAEMEDGAAGGVGHGTSGADKQGVEGLKLLGVGARSVPVGG